MWLKEEGNRLIQPPVNYQTADGWIDLADPVLLSALQAGSITAEEITAIKAEMNRGITWADLSSN